VTSKFVLRIPFVTQYKIILTLGVNELRRIRRAEHVSRIGRNRNAYKVLVGRNEGKRVLVGPDLRRNGYFKTDTEQNSSEDVVSGSSWFSDRLL